MVSETTRVAAVTGGAGHRRQLRRRQAVPRPLVPADVAGVVAFLASGAAAALMGQTLCADGGLVRR